MCVVSIYDTHDTCIMFDHIKAQISQRSPGMKLNEFFVHHLFFLS